MKKICTQCHYIGKEVSHTKGTFLMEIVLWIFFIVPGMVYSMWRLSTREKVCPQCGQRTMIPVTSARGLELSS
jgi:ribosomal protein S27AE